MGSTFGMVEAITQGKQYLRYSTQGSTVFDLSYNGLDGSYDSHLSMRTSYQLAPIQTKSLEASNASMTQSVPELSLAQKLFSALTKILQTNGTNLDNVLNLVR